MILDEHGGLIWFDPLAPGARAGDLQVQSYRGQPVLTWWQDPLVAGGSRSAGGVIADSSYRQIAVVRAGNGYQADLHEFQLTPGNTALVTVYDAIRCDLSSVGGPRKGAVADTLFQEIDLATGLVRYEWHFLDHVPMSSSYYSAHGATLDSPSDPFHINSVEAERDGSFLVDARNTWAAYDVDHTAARSAGSWGASTAASSPAREPGPRGSTTPASSPMERSPSSTTVPRPVCTRRRGRSKWRSTPSATRRRWCAPIRIADRWWPTARATCRCSPMETGRSGGGRRAMSRRSNPPAGSCSTPICRPAGRAIAVSCCPGVPVRRRRRAWPWSAGASAAWSPTQAGTGPPGWPPGGCWAAPRRVLWRPWRALPGGASRRASRCRRRPPACTTWRCRPWAAKVACSPGSRPVRAPGP